MIQNKTIWNRVWAVVLTVMVTAGLLAALTGSVRADATTYSSKKRAYKVGILLVDSTTDNSSAAQTAKGAENPDPYTFYVADQRSDVKPQNWELVNPLAPSTVTSDIKARWDARDPNHPYQIGQKVTKDMACYWEVFLNRVSESDLLKYDLLFITNHRSTGFTPADRERLRKVVDAGGIVWLEDCGGLRIQPGGRFFLDNFQFRALGGGVTGQPVINVPDHPILSAPYKLTFDEIANLGDKNYSTYMSGFPNTETPTTGVNAGYTPNSADPPAPEVLVNVVGNSKAAGLPYIAAGNYGSGAIVATSSDTACDCNDYVGGTNTESGGNSGAYSGTDFQAAKTAALKFQYNLIAWGSSNTTERRNNRRTASEFEGTGAPLIARFDTSLPLVGDSTVKSQSAPLIVKGAVFSAGLDSLSGKPTLRAYVATPSRSLVDQGRPDLSLGTNYDEIWRVDVPDASGNGQPSAPVYATVYDPTSRTQREVIFVTTPVGGLFAVGAFSADAAGRYLSTPATLFTNKPSVIGATAYAAGTVAPAPTFVEGKVYVVQPDGVVRCVDPTTGKTLWVTLDTATTGTITPTGSPTVGYSRLSGTTQFAVRSGNTTVDLMLYLPVSEAKNGATNGYMLPYWLGTRNEVQKNFNSTGPGVFSTRIVGKDGIPQKRYRIARNAPFVIPHARVFGTDYNADGTVRISRETNYNNGVESKIWTVDPATGFLTGTEEGQVRVTPIGGGAATPNQGEVLIAVDYDILNIVPGDPNNYPSSDNDYGSRDFQSLRIENYVRGLTGAAMSPDDVLFYAADQDSSGRTTAPTPPPASLSSVYATNEQFGSAGTNTKTKWRFMLHDGTNGQPITVSNVDVVETAPITNSLLFSTNWPLTNEAIQGTPENLTNIRVVGTPVTTTDGVTYQLARGTSPANGGPVSIVMAFRANQTTILNVGAFTGAATVSQYNPLDGSTITLDGSQYTSDPNAGRVTIQNFHGTNNALSSSSSFIVQVTPVGQTQPSAPQVHAPIGSRYGDDFSPLLWYYVLPGEPQGGLTLSGDNLFFTQSRNGGQSIVAVDANPKSNDSITNGSQILNVVGRIKTSVADPGKVTTVNHVAWASQPVGLTTGNVANATSAPSVGQGTFMLNTDKGLFVFEDAITLVTDNKRVLEVNTSGEAVWSLDSTVNSQIVGGNATIYGVTNPTNPGQVATIPGTGRRNLERRSLSRPAFARRLSGSDYLIADTGNNRVVRVDRSGALRWEMETFRDAYNILSTGDPITLSDPTDVQFYLATTLDPVAGTPVGYEANYIVADTGNNRIIHVVDFYDAKGTPVGAICDPAAPGAVQDPNFANVYRLLNTAGQHILIWTTHTSSQEGRRLRYEHLQLTFDGDTPDGQAAGGYGYPRLVAVVGNTSVAGATSTGTADYTGGSIVVVDYRPYHVNYTIRDATGNVLSIYTPWSLAPDARGTEPKGNGTIFASVDDVIVDGAVKKITRPTYFETLKTPIPGGGGATRRTYLVCDADGVYEIEPRTDPTTGKQVRYVLWYFSRDDYNAMNGVVGNSTTGGIAQAIRRLTLPFAAGATVTADQYNVLPGFAPSSIKRVGSGNYLIANSYSGRSPFFDTGQFVGEVFEIVPNRTATGGLTPHGGTYADFSSPRILGGNGVNQQRMGGGTGNTSLLEQPKSADRLF